MAVGRLSAQELSRRAREITWLLLDVDGVLTDGRLFYGPAGQELQSFDIKDGMGMKLAQGSGIGVGILSGRRSTAVEARARELGLDLVVTGRLDKLPAFEELLERTGASPEAVAFVGDDLPDLPVLHRCGLAFAPSDAVAEVRAAAHVELTRPGGRGAVREAIELLLRWRGQWQEVVARFTGP